MKERRKKYENWSKEEKSKEKKMETRKWANGELTTLFQS